MRLIPIALPQNLGRPAFWTAERAIAGNFYFVLLCWRLLIKIPMGTVFSHTL